MKIKATIITIGDELLIGQTVDTNSVWIGQELNKIGVGVYQKIAIGDDATQITEVFRDAAQTSNIILITGGLGPTKDDITKKTLAEYFGVGFTFYETVWEKMKAIFEKRGAKVLEMNKSQAMLPSNAQMLPNQRGTAQGMWFDENGVVYVSMPGVPHEMKHLMEQVLPKLHQRFELPQIIHRTVMTAGAGESTIATMLTDFENALPPNIKLAYLPDLGVVKLRLSAYEDVATEEVDLYLEQLKSILKGYVYCDGELSLQEVVGSLLLKQKNTLATAESCTGGYLAHLITSIPGSSEYFLGSIVSYSNNLKTNLLHVQQETLGTQGAVSEATVIEMVKGTLQQTGATYAVAISGVAGPGGGTAEKPVGTVCFAVGSKERIVSRKLHFFPSRLENIKVSANTALNLVRKFILEEI
ncbi:MAG: competence/damage-inducible protein A [Chitinophagales bacterium]|nr:competence/damage-inducible protein A [Chitinophagales bacterium]